MFADDTLSEILADKLESEELREFNRLIESYGVSFAKSAAVSGLQIDKFDRYEPGESYGPRI